MLEGIRGAVDEWPAKTLSYAGKLELVSFEIDNEIDWLNLFGIPAALIHSLERLCSLSYGVLEWPE